MTNIDHPVPALSAGSVPELESDGGLQSPLGRRRFIAGVGAAAGAAALATALPTGSAFAAEGDVPPEGASQFHVLESPVRVADTNPDDNGYRNYTYASNQGEGETIRIPIAGLYGVAPNASAIVATVTMVNWEPTRGNVATLYPSGTVRDPETSNLNAFDRYQMCANLAVVKLGADGAVEFWLKYSGRIILDLVGYCTPVTTAVREGRFIPLDVPLRTYDVRPGGPKLGSGQYVTVDIDTTSPNSVPLNASAVVVNLTATEVISGSFFTVYPYANKKGELTGANVPNTSTLNVSVPNETRAAAMICAVSNIDNRLRINVYARFEGHIVVDIMGYFTGPEHPLDTVGLFVPAAPVRIRDTRLPGQGGVQWSGWSNEIEVPAVAAANGGAIVANVTLVQGRRENYLKVARARINLGDFSNVNAMRKATDIPNLAYSRITGLAEKPGAAAIQVQTKFPSHIAVDYAGYFVGKPLTTEPTTSKPINPDPDGGPLPWRIVFNKPMSTAGGNVMPLTRDGDAVRVTDGGELWHWQGTGLVGDDTTVSVFGHRTEAGGPFNRLQTLGPGDTWTVDTADGRRYTYAYADRKLTDANTTNILNATRSLGAPKTMALIACTNGVGANQWNPTSIRYRIIVLGVQVKFEQIADIIL